jgi:hypothetical protein
MEAVVFPSPFRLSPHRLRLGRLLGCALGVASASAALTLTAFSGASAQAALIATGACNEAPLSQPFVRWDDLNSYEMVAGGDFESTVSGWTLSGGAQRVPGSEPYGASGSVGAYSLALPAGASATSTFTCVNASYPSFRFFARNNGLASTVLVQVVYRTPLGSLSVPVGVVSLSGAWQPSLPMLTGSIAGGVLSDGTGEVALRFTALIGPSRIDDVFIDPHMR